MHSKALRKKVPKKDIKRGSIIPKKYIFPKGIPWYLENTPCYSWNPTKRMLLTALLLMHMNGYKIPHRSRDGLETLKSP